MLHAAEHGKFSGGRDPDLVLVFNQALTALEILIYAAHDGSQAAHAYLESTTEKLVDAAGKCGRMPLDLEDQ